jgi:hypothetical protein
VRALFVNDSTTDANWGGRAATVSLRMMIAHSGCEITETLMMDDLVRTSFGASAVEPQAAHNDHRDTLRPFIPPVLLGLRRRLLSRSRGTGDVPISPIPSTWDDYQRCMSLVLGSATPWPLLLDAIETTDVTVIYGNGDIYGNHTLPRTLLFLGFLIKRHFQKPVIMVNHSADLDHPELRRVAENVYPLFDDVVFRDQVSLEQCRGLCAGRFAADTAFWFEPAHREEWVPVAGRPTYYDVWPDEAAFDPSGPYLCLGGSSLFDTPDSSVVRREYASLIQQLQAEYSGQVVLTASCHVDQAVFRPLAQQLRLPLISAPTPVQQAVDVLGNADAYIGGRYHPSVFALRGGTPVLALSAKTFKMRALTEMAGLPSTTFDALTPGDERRAILRQLMACLDQGDDLRERLRSWAREMAVSSWENVAYLQSDRRA